MKPRIVYRRSGENLAFLNDCLATQLEAIIKELERGSQSPPEILESHTIIKRGLRIK